MSQPNLNQLCHLAQQHHQAGRFVNAESTYRQILALSPHHADALNLLGMLAGQTGRIDAAIDLISRAIAANPLAPHYHSNLAIAFREKGNLDQSIAASRRAIQLQPNFAPAHNNLGIALRDQNDLNQAAAAYQQAIQIDPNYADAHNNLGIVFNELQRLDEAIQCYQQAIRLRPDFAAAFNNLGTALKDKGSLPQAIEAFTRAIQLNPHYSEARWNRSLALLLTGDFQNGWREHESRLQSIPSKKFPQPRWNGSDLNGRTILLHPEQGIGDTLQFARYAPLVASRGGNVILACPPELARLLQTIPGISQIAPTNQPPPPFEVHCPLMSLPLIFSTDQNSIAAPIPYIFPDPTVTETWKNKLPPHQGKTKIGLAWAGNPKHPRDRQRSIPITELSPLLEASKEKNIQFHSLQKGATIPQSLPVPIKDWTPDLQDFADTAALIANLDLIITVDTAVAHLAGAIGKPVWLLLPFIPDWRWLLNRTDSPWYPTMRLFRQPFPNNWHDPIQNVCNALNMNHLVFS